VLVLVPSNPAGTLGREARATRPAAIPLFTERRVMIKSDRGWAESDEPVIRAMQRSGRRAARSASGVYAGRTAGRHRHYCDAGSAVVAGPVQSQSPGAT